MFTGHPGKILHYASLSLSLLWLLASCSSPEPDVSFYYWKSQFELSPAERAALDTLNARRLYVKFLDVDLENGRPVPKAPIRFAAPPPPGYDIIPCVFITNRTFQAAVKPAQLAEQVWEYLQQINRRHHITPLNYQFDCDWSASTRDAYFAFLQRINQLKENEVLSATIRLHQYRYPKEAGVPPVSEGTLMYYNMGDIEDVEETNSILNNEKAKAYLSAGKYPLPLNVALPLFSWALVYRLGGLSAIINLQDQQTLDAQEQLEKTGPGLYRVRQNFYFEGHYLNQGDRLRFEQPSREELEEAIKAARKINNRSEHILFFHLDEDILANYPPAFLRRLSRDL